MPMSMEMWTGRPPIVGRVSPPSPTADRAFAEERVVQGSFASDLESQPLATPPAWQLTLGLALEQLGSFAADPAPVGVGGGMRSAVSTASAGFDCQPVCAASGRRP